MRASRFSPSSGSGRLYAGATALLGPAPFIIFGASQAMPLASWLQRPIGITLVFVGAMFAIGVGLAMTYWFILARWENRSGRVLDRQVIALYVFNPASAYFFYDWARRADKIAFPVWEVILPIAGFVLSWLVFRVFEAKSLPDAAQEDL